jgi:hypothetical protein
MLRVVKRGQEADLDADAAPHHFLFHGELVLLVQSFPLYFARLPVGGRNVGTGHALQCVNPKSPNVAYPVVPVSLHYQHRICFWIIAGLTARDHLYAHTRQATGKNAGPTGLYVDSPYCIGGGGSIRAPYSSVTSNHNRNTPPFAEIAIGQQRARSMFRAGTM